MNADHVVERALVKLPATANRWRRYRPKLFN